MRVGVRGAHAHVCGGARGGWRTRKLVVAAHMVAAHIVTANLVAAARQQIMSHGLLLGVACAAVAYLAFAEAYKYV